MEIAKSFLQDPPGLLANPEQAPLFWRCTIGSSYVILHRLGHRGRSVPTISGIPGPYRFFFYSFDCGEPRHVHVRRDRANCKYWLDPVELAANNGFSNKDLNRIRKIIRDNLNIMREAWDEHCGQ